MKIYFSGTNTSLKKLLSSYGDVVSGKDWLEKSHVFIFDTIENKEILIQDAQDMLKPVLLLSKSTDSTLTLDTNGYPFLMTGRYKDSSEIKEAVGAFFEEYGGSAKENTACCGGGCCSSV